MTALGATRPPPPKYPGGIKPRLGPGGYLGIGLLVLTAVLIVREK